MPALATITLRHLRLPLQQPYRLSYRTFTEFEPYLVEATTADGAYGFGDGHISPGSSAETREGGWRFLEKLLPALVGCEVDDAIEVALARAPASKTAASAVVTALEHARATPLLELETACTLPLLAPVSGLDAATIEREIAARLENGFRTFKVKVGNDVAADLDRVAVIQAAVGGRAALRLDANRAFSREEALRFVAGLDPAGIELFEQPCAAEDWAANAAVAAASPVPLMLDEPICSPADIERAATFEGVGFCKLKLKRFVSLRALHDGLERVRACGMEPVLGDGLGSDVTNWMEACLAARSIRNAGEFNGFLKPTEGLFTEPLAVRRGAVTLAPGWRPTLDRDRLERLTVAVRRFA